MGEYYYYLIEKMELRDVLCAYIHVLPFSICKVMYHMLYVLYFAFNVVLILILFFSYSYPLARSIIILPVS